MTIEMKIERNYAIKVKTDSEEMIMSSDNLEHLTVCFKTYVNEQETSVDLIDCRTGEILAYYHQTKRRGTELYIASCYEDFYYNR